MVYESFDWQHGVFIGAAMRSEATAAAEHKGTDPHMFLRCRSSVKLSGAVSLPLLFFT